MVDACVGCNVVGNGFGRFAGACVAVMVGMMRKSKVYVAGDWNI